MRERHPEVREVRAVTKDHAQEYAVSHFEDVCNATRNQAIAHLRMMWRILIEDGTAKIPMNVRDGIKKRREVHTRRRELTVEELGRVVARLKGEMRVLFAVGIYTGLRLGDCSMLEWGQVDLVRGFISLIPRKTARKNEQRCFGMWSLVVFVNAARQDKVVKRSKTTRPLQGLIASSVVVILNDNLRSSRNTRRYR